MKTMIRMEVKDFQKALKALGAVVPTKSALPILQSVMLQYVEEKKLFMLSASDSENWLDIECATTSDNGEKKSWALMIDNDRKDPMVPVCIGYQKLSAAISALPAALTVIMWIESKGDQLQLRVDYQTGEFSIPCERADEFPITPALSMPENPQQGVDPVCMFTMDAHWLIPRMQSARAAISTGAGAELRPVMTCECMDVDHEGLTLVASDGHKLMRDRYEVGMGAGFLQMFKKDEKGNVMQSVQLLLTPRASSTAVKTFASHGDIAIAADSHMVRIVQNGCTLTAVTLDSKYPNYKSVIPKNPHQLVVDRQTLQSVLQRIRIFSDEASELASMSYKEGQLVVSTEDVGNSLRASERIAVQNAADTTLPEKFAIGFKHSTLREMIGCSDCENLIIHLNTPDTAITITEEDKNSQLLALVMPMLLNK